MKIILKYIASILSCLVVGVAHAQFGPAPIPKDTTQTTEKVKVKEKIVRDFKPSAIKIGVDGLGLARTAFSSGFSHFEGQFDIDFHRYFLVLDYGREERTISGDDFTYRNEGSYYRIGIQANMMQFNKDRNVIFFGLRYARSNFNDRMTLIQSSDGMGSSTGTFSNPNLSSRWFELNMGMKVQVVKNLFLGYTIRFKVAKNISDFESLSPYTIPGFGLASKGSNLGFSYYILYRLPFRKKAIPERLIRTRVTTPPGQ